MLKGRTEHFKTKMHINYLQQQEQLDRLQEIEDIKEQELRDNNAEVETWKAEEEEDARLEQQQKLHDELREIQDEVKARIGAGAEDKRDSQDIQKLQSYIQEIQAERKAEMETGKREQWFIKGPDGKTVMSAGFVKYLEFCVLAEKLG